MFFTAINQMMTEGVDLTLVIRKANGQMAVSVLPKSNGLKDEAQNHIIPLPSREFRRNWIPDSCKPSPGRCRKPRD